MRALIIEDEAQIAEAVAASLADRRIASDICHFGEDGLARVRTGGYDVIILDIMLPDIDGIEIMRRVRALRIDVPIIVLTARDSLTDRVGGLELGADDYLTKPFYMEELVARIGVVIRRKNGRPSEAISCNKLTIQPETRSVLVDGMRIRLTAREYELLSLLMRAPDHVFTAHEIIEEIWESSSVQRANLVQVYINRLRAKIAAAGVPESIHTIRGVGYSMSFNGNE